MAMKENEIIEDEIMDDDIEDSDKSPNFLFEGDEEFGVMANELNYILVSRIVSNKKSKNEDGAISNVKYYRWKNVAYLDSLESVLECYMKRKEKILVSKLKGCKGFGELNLIRKEIKSIIYNSLSPIGINKDLLDACKLVDFKLLLNSEILELENKKKELMEEFEKTMNFIKEKRSIIIKQTEPKKHRNKKEED